MAGFGLVAVGYVVALGDPIAFLDQAKGGLSSVEYLAVGQWGLLRVSNVDFANLLPRVVLAGVVLAAGPCFRNYRRSARCSS